MEHRPTLGRGRGRGREPPKPGVEAAQPQAIAVPEPVPEVLSAAVKQMEIQEPVLSGRPVHSGLPAAPAGAGRGRGRGVVKQQKPAEPGSSPPPETTAEAKAREQAADESVYEPPEDVDLPQSPTAAQPEGGVGAAVEAPVAPAAEPEPRDPNRVPTVTGSDGFTAHLKGKSEREPVLKHGDKGEEIQCAANFVRVRITENKGLYEYRVEFSPHTEEMDLRKKALNACKEHIGLTKTFDGQTLYLPSPLPSSMTSVSVANPNDPASQLRLTFKFIKKQTILDCVQFYNVLLRRIQKELGYVEMGRNFYDARATHEIPQHKLQIWPGYVTRIDETEGGVMLCLDASHRVLRTTTVLEMWESMKHQPGDAKNAFTEFITGKLVLARYNKLCYRIDDVAWNINPTETFLRHGKEVTYLEYYKTQHGQVIKDHSQPILVSKPKPKKNDKSGEIRLICLIPELCYMSGLSEEQTSNFTIMKDIAQFTKITPQQRQACLTQYIKNVKENVKASTILSDWGLEFEDRLLQMKARVMTAPTLAFNDKFELKNAKADFSREATSNPCYRPVPLRRFVILCTSRDKQKAEGMMKTMFSVCGPLGIATGQKGDVIAINGNRPNDFKVALQQYANPETIQFVVVMLPVARDDLYSAVKNFCLVERPIPSQIILSKTLNNEKRVRSVMQKVALQINCKLGGALWALRIPISQTIMFIGIDVYHDPKRKNPSVTAVVSALDTNCTQYYSRVIFQRPHQESVETITGVFVNALDQWRELNGRFPDRVIVFRDGVGDGQWELTKETEVKQLLHGLNITCGDTQPVFTFVVVQKKINERFFTLKGSRYENPVPGSVLDHTVTRQYHFDFFIVSQLVREGTVSPTHFIVLEDNSNIKADLIQKFAYSTAFMYFNWCGTIRVPAMCQYAHKLAYLAGQHLRSEPSITSARQLYYL